MPASNKVTTLQKINPMLWRQSRVVKKTANVVDEHVKEMTKCAPFLVFCEKHALEGSPHDGKSGPLLALLDRVEITTGRLLGEGAFSQVYEVTGITLQNRDSENLGSGQEAARQQLKDTVLYDASEHGEDDATSRMVDDSIKVQEEDITADLPKLPKYRYAIKQLRRDLLRKPYDFGMAMADMVIEAKYLSQLDHPNILRVKGLALGGTAAMMDSGRFDSYFLLTDRLTTSLDQRIEAWQRLGPPDPNRIPRKTNYALQIAHALAYLHERRILFRDLKPENVGFLHRHTIQLFDFGLCRELPAGAGYDNELYAMSGTGSQWYMAVEIFITGKYNLKADVYSWAMTCYEMLTESKPFAKWHKLQHAAVVCIRGKRPSLSSHNLPQRLEAIIRKAWTQSVAKRPDMVAVVKELESMLPEMGDQEACSWPTPEEHKTNTNAPCSNDVAFVLNLHREQQCVQRQEKIKESLREYEALHPPSEQPLAGKTNATTNPPKDDDEDSFFNADFDKEIDSEIRKRMAEGTAARPPANNGEVLDDEDTEAFGNFSITSLCYEDH